MTYHTGYSKAYELFLQLPFGSIRQKVVLSGIEISDKSFEWLLAQKDYATVEAYIGFMRVNEQKVNVLLAHYKDNWQATDRLLNRIANNDAYIFSFDQFKQLLDNKSYAAAETTIRKRTPSKEKIEEVIAHYADNTKAVSRIMKIIAEQYQMDPAIICRIHEKYPQLMKEVSSILQEKSDQKYLRDMCTVNSNQEFLKREMSVPMQKILVHKHPVFAAVYMEVHDFDPQVIEYIVRGNMVKIIQEMLVRKRGGQLLIDLLNNSDLFYLLH